MTREEIIVKLTPMVREAFQDETLTITDEMSAATVNGWTSLAFMQLLTNIEEQLGFRFKMMELLQLKTMGDIINAISSHMN